LLLLSYFNGIFFSNYDVPQCLSQDAWGHLGYPKHDLGGSTPQRVGTFAFCFLDKLFPFNTTCCFKFLICFVNKLQFVVVSHQLPGWDSCRHWCVVDHSVAKIFFVDIPSAESWSIHPHVCNKHIWHRLQHLQQATIHVSSSATNKRIW